MVIADDNFATIVEAVREGRAISAQHPEVHLLPAVEQRWAARRGLRGVVHPGFLPLTPLMILWINLVTNGLPALALGVDPPDPTQMREAPRPPSSGLLGTREYLGIIVVGVWMGLAALFAYEWRWQPGTLGFLSHYQATHSGQAGRAVAFSLLALSPLFHAANCRSATTSVARLRPLVSRPLVVGVGLSAAIHLVVFIPVLQPIFRTFTMNVGEWVFLLVMSASIVPAFEAWKLLLRWLLAVRGRAEGARRPGG